MDQSAANRASAPGGKGAPARANLERGAGEVLHAARLLPFRKRSSLAPEEIDHELVWLLVSLGGALSLTTWLAARLPTPPCVFHSLTGLPCVTCGATRAATHFLHGDFLTSFLFNPLAFLTFCGLCVFDLYAVTVLATRAPRLRFSNFNPGQKRLFRSVVIFLLAANWLYLLIARPF